MSRGGRAAVSGLRLLLIPGFGASLGPGVLCRQLPAAVAAAAAAGGGCLAAAGGGAPAPWATFAASRSLSAAAAPEGTERQRRRRGANQQQQEELVAAGDEFSALTDKIPQRPVSVVEGTSYTLVILAALGLAAAVLWAALGELLFTPREYQCHAAALARLQDDPRVTVRLGSPLSSYGTESRNRAARQRIPHRIATDAQGREHVQLQFQLRGPAGRATVNADMYQDGGAWRYHFLYLDVHAPVPQQVVLVRPGQVDEY